MSVLFINACVREDSRTRVVAKEYLKGVQGDVKEVNLEKIGLQPLDKERLEKRDRMIASGDFCDEIFCSAKEFAAADEIVIAAPFWDLSFPSLLKIYLENITVSGITFRYDNGKPVGLCKAKKLTYITTAGGKIFLDFGYAYVKALAKNFYGIEKVSCIKIEDTDVKMLSTKSVLSEQVVVIED